MIVNLVFVISILQSLNESYLLDDTLNIWKGFISIVHARNILACENIRFSSLFVAENVSRGGTSATQRQKFHTDDANQCLHNKSGSHGVPNINLSNFAFVLVDFCKVLC